MIRKAVVPFVLAVSALGLSLQAHAAPASTLAIGSQVLNNASAGIMSSKRFDWYCGKTDSKGKGFRGNMLATLVYLPNGIKEVRISSVNIHKKGGQSGGNKANFEAHLTYSDAYLKSAYSYDNLKQDGSVNNLNWVLSTANSAFTPNNLRIKFTFDKSGSDPTCVSNLAL